MVVARVPPVAPRLVVDELVLSRWSTADLDELAEMHVEEATMATLGGPLTSRADSDAYAERAEACFERNGWGLFCVHDADGALLGAVGLAEIPPAIGLDFDAEVGWRLRQRAWGRGVATRSAAAVLAWASSSGGPRSVCSFTAVSNLRSRAVMERLGLHRRADLDFEHPRLAEGHPLRPHVVYATEAAPPAAG